MNGDLAIVRKAVGEALMQLRPVAAFLLIWTVVYASVLAPPTAWALERLITQSGAFAVSNEDIAAFLLSPAGCIFLVVGGALNLAFLYAQQAVLFIIASGVELGGRSAMLSLVSENLKRIPALARLGLLQLGAFVAMAIPFAVAIVLTAWWLLDDHDVNYYLTREPAEWIWTLRVALSLLGLYAVAAAVLYLRWIFAVPLLVVAHEKPKEALRRSWALSRGRVNRLGTPLVFWWLAWLLVSTLAGTIFLAVARWSVSWALASAFAMVPVLLLLQTIGSIGGLIGAFVGGVVHQFITARLFWNFNPTDSVDATSSSVPFSLPFRRTIAVVVGAAFIMSASATWWQARDVRDGVAVEITAHRGSSRRAPENTLSALRQAIQDGADYVEIDVQSTKDGEIVVLHDGDLMRLANDPRKVFEMTLAELKQVDIGSWFSSEFSAERPASLAEVIDLAEGRIKLNIELKYNQPDPALAGRVLDLLRARNFINQCVVTSLSAKDLMGLEQEAPEIKTGLIVTAALGDFSRLQVDFLSLNAAQVSHSTIRSASRQGKSVHAWTINTEEQALRMLERGVDNLITDEPEQMVKLRQTLRDQTLMERIAVAWTARHLL